MPVSVREWAVAKEAGWFPAILTVSWCCVSSPARARTVISVSQTCSERLRSLPGTQIMPGSATRTWNYPNFLGTEPVCRASNFTVRGQLMSFQPSQEAKNDNPRPVVIEYKKTSGRSLRQCLPKSTSRIKTVGLLCKVKKWGKEISEKCLLNFCNPLRARM